MLGIVTEITLATVPQYKLSLTVTNDYDDNLLADRIPALLSDPSFSRVMWYPNAHTALTKWHTILPPDAPGSVRHSFLDNRIWASVGGQIGLAIDQINFTPFPSDKMIRMFMKHHPPFFYTDERTHLWSGLNKTHVGWSHRLAGSSCLATSWGCYWRNQVQQLVEMDMDVAVLPDWIREMRVLMDKVEDHGCLPFLVGFAMRFGHASEAPLDMAYGRDTVYIDMLIAKA